MAPNVNKKDLLAILTNKAYVRHILRHIIESAYIQ